MLLKIITFNVAHGRGTDNKVDIERQANLIKEYKPDIIFLRICKKSWVILLFNGKQYNTRGWILW